MHALAYGFSIGLTIIIPLVFAVILRRRFRVSWFLFGVGSLTFIGSQVVHLPLNNLLTKLGILPSLHAPQGWSLLAMAIVLGLTAGLCEELARALGYYLLKSSRKFADGVMLGLGHGGIEAMILVGILAAGTIGQLFALRGTDLSTLGMSSDQLTYITGQMELFNHSPLNAFMPLLERLIAMTVHVVLSMMVLYAFQTRKSRWVVAAILYHAFIDAVAGTGWKCNFQRLVMEGAFLATIIPGLIWVINVFGQTGQGNRAAGAPG